MGVLCNMIGSKQIDKIMCIACQNLIGEHSKRGLGRCLFRVQGTLIAEGKERVDKDIEKYKSNSLPELNKGFVKQKI